MSENREIIDKLLAIEDHMTELDKKIALLEEMKKNLDTNK